MTAFARCGMRERGWRRKVQANSSSLKLVVDRKEIDLIGVSIDAIQRPDAPFLAWAD